MVENGVPSAPTEGLPTGFLAPGQVLGDRYQIRSQLGRGGMGEVWRAFDVKLRVDVALKAMLPDLFKDEKRRDMLRREVRAAREVVSPNVCRIFDLIEVEGRELVSMEYVDGGTLLSLLGERGPLDLKEAQDIASQFLAALEAIHQAGLVHRDVKPENIMITRAGRVVLMDFGLARQEDSGAGTVSGTPAYMAPEQAAGLQVDARADVYSAGVVLAEMVSPEGIKNLQSRQSVWEGIRQEPARVPDSPWAPVLKKAVAKDPDQRYNSAHTLIRELEDVTLRVEGAEDLTPYPGLASFTEEDAEYFFGREAEIEAMWSKIQGPPRLLAIMGPSGAGKTSFIRAGLVPHSPSGWTIVRCTPGGTPFASLRSALTPGLTSDTGALQALMADPGNPDVIVGAFGNWRRGDQCALLIVDQFEELFTLNLRQAEVEFSDLLGRLPLEADVHVVVSMRDDFAASCNAFEPLRPIFHELTVLDPPTGANLRRALVRPATKCGYRFEDDDLVDEILAEVEDERGALPLVAFAMSRLWGKRDRDNGLLTRQAYRDIGGVGGALAQHAEASIDRIGVNRLPIVRELFRNLVTAEGTRAVREWDELLSVFDESQRQPAGDVVRELIDARLMTSYEIHDEDRDPTRRVEIIHESLLANWPRLVGWQTQDADAVQMRDQVRQAARMWDERGQPADLLWTGTSFKEYELWQERHDVGLSETERRFTKAMVARATRLKRRRRRAVALALLVTSSLAVAAGIGWRIARLERDRANLEVDTLVATGNFLIDQFRAEEADELTARDIVTRAGERILAEDDIPLVQARMLDTIGRIHMNLADYERGAQMLEESVRVKHERLSGDHETIAGGLLNLGFILNDMALLDAAESLLQRSLAMYRRLGDDVLTARSMNMLGCVYYEWRRYGEANRRFEEALQIAREAGRPRELLFPLNNVAEVQIETRDYSSAAESLSEAVEIAEQIGYSGPVVTSLEINLGKIAVRRGDPREGIARLRRVLADLQGPGPSTPTRRGQQGELLVEIARGQLDLGEYDEAVLQLRRAIALLNDQRNPPRSRGYAAEAYVMLAEALIEQGEIQAAAEVIDQGKTSLEQVLPVGHPSRVMLAEFSIETPGIIDL